jgi:hypothetical protein
MDQKGSNSIQLAGKVHRGIVPRAWLPGARGRCGWR